MEELFREAMLLMFASGFVGGILGMVVYNFFIKLDKKEVKE